MIQQDLKTTLVAMAAALWEAAACDDFDTLRSNLRTNDNGVSYALIACVTPLLTAPMQWLPSSQANDYCSEDPCKRVVKQFSHLAPCTWETQVPSDSDGNALAMAQQVMRDCPRQ
ncbi:hypothetical protein BBJ29_006435 [Phytophthora kernoviae]|uniref:Secreted protein n=1 Tax=Phytophthora kernoviae TaxID=325452 RepID=A0A421GAY5_9STRA|nr:hypothetical protein BBJ29_006435 [Phytophthora kernoviae]